MYKDYLAIKDYTLKYYKDLLTEEELDLIKNYTLKKFQDINHDLRNDKKNKDALILKNALNKFRLDRELIVYRKTTFIIRRREFLKSLEKGFFIDKGFQSTSLVYDGYKGFNNTEMLIRIENPNCGAFIEPFSYYPREQEFLITSNTRVDIEDLEVTDKKIKLRGVIK